MLRQKVAQANALVLTFDDGPGERLTPIILELLSKHNVKATFFLLGKNISGREAIVRQIVAGDHEICSHGYDHLHQWKVSPIRAIKDIKQGWQAIDNALRINRGKYPFRPPYGKLNLICLIYLLLHRVPIVYWSLDTRDTRPRAYHDKDRITALAKKTGGAVTLSHDFDRSDNANDCFVLESIRSIITMAQQSDLQMLTVSQLLENKK